MKLSLAGFVLRQVGDHLRQLAWTHVLTCGVMAVALFVLGAFMLVEINLQKLLSGWSGQMQIIAYLSESASEEDDAAALRKIEAIPEIAEARYISREQAWRDFQAALGAQSGLLDGLPREVLPASIEISLKPPFADSAAVEAVATRLRQQRGISAVEYPSVWVDRLSLAISWVQWVKWLLAAALFLAAFFVVGSTIKLAAVARRDEVEIMQLVGASEELIEAPFVIEGMLQGTIGAALALAALAAVFLALQAQMAPAGGLLAPLAAPEFLDLRRIGILVLAGVLLGATGSLAGLRRFVRTWRAA